MIGSSNLTNRALSQNHEWNLKVSAASGSDLANQLLTLLEDQVAASEPLTQEWIDEYTATYVAPPRRQSAKPSLPDAPPSHPTIEPNVMQQDALLALDFARAQGAERAIVISATGTGKTMLSALDVRSVNPNRMLFVVHREQILDRTIREYRRVLGGPATDYGLLTGTSKQLDRRFVFATIQTLSQESTLDSVSPEAFDYVIIDEAHRAGAPTYQRVIDRLNPSFLLGMTATPERTDGFNVFELFHYNVPYEIRLGKALEAEMLSPFHYYGIADITYEDDLTTSEDTPLRLLISPERVNHLIRAIELYGQAGIPARGLIFCSRVEEARDLSAELNKHQLRGRQLRTVALTGADSIESREARVSELEAGELDYILTVDVFNEGVDIPSVNQVIMLRQTQSAIVFVQQLGRGLRLASGKDYLVVIDFIGNYTNNFLIPIALFGDESLNRESLRERLNETVEGGALPGLSSVSFDEISRERILSSISQTQLDSMSNLKNALLAMRNRVGGVPKLWDFYRFQSVDPVLLATKREHYPALVQALLRVESELGPAESRALNLISHEVLAAKRLHEFLLLELLLANATVTKDAITRAFTNASIASGPTDIQSTLDTFALTGYAQADVTRYQVGYRGDRGGDMFASRTSSRRPTTSSAALREAIADILEHREATHEGPLPIGSTLHSWHAVLPARCRSHLGWPRASASTIYGVKTDEAPGRLRHLRHAPQVETRSPPVLHIKIDCSTPRPCGGSRGAVAPSRAAMSAESCPELWLSTSSSRRTMLTGASTTTSARPHRTRPGKTTMPDDKGRQPPVVTMLLKFDRADQARTLRLLPPVGG